MGEGLVAPRLNAPAGEEAPRPDTAWWGVHAARYRFAAQHLDCRRLLDVACGTGYGLAMLSKPGRQVFGVDVDREALLGARQAAPVVTADGGALPFPDGTFEAVTTFETIEHLEHRTEFLAEVARVLVPGGSILLSTPNALYTDPVAGRPRNPFHVIEYTPDELVAEVGRHFDDIQLMGQRLSPRFVISPFWDDQRRLPRTVRSQSRLLVWRALNRLPPGPRDLLSRAMWRHPLYPDENDYLFTPEAVRAAPVLLTTARASERRR
jgi:SAM-dependent methyltransferase